MMGRAKIELWGAMLINRLVAATCLCCSLVVAAPAVDAADWKIIDLGSLGGSYSDGKDLNSQSQVVGSAYTAKNASYRAFLYDQGKITDLGTLGGLNSIARGISDGGLVVGGAYTTGNAAEHAFLFAPDTGMTDLGTLGGKNSVASAINNQGEVVGYADTRKYAVYHAFLYREGKMRDLGTLGGTTSQARAINDQGEVAGDADTRKDGGYHAFLYRHGKMRDLGTLGGTASYGRAVNEAGEVAGDSDTRKDAAHHVFLYRYGKKRDLGTLGGRNSFASGLNNQGQVVGYSDTAPVPSPYKYGDDGHQQGDASPSGNASPLRSVPLAPSPGTMRAHIGNTFESNHHAFLYDAEHGMVDLSQLPEVHAAGWTSLNYAYAINDRGEIAGSGTIGGAFHAFLLVPVTAAK